MYVLQHIFFMTSFFLKKKDDFLSISYVEFPIGQQHVRACSDWSRLRHHVTTARIYVLTGAKIRHLLFRSFTTRFPCLCRK